MLRSSQASDCAILITILLLGFLVGMRHALEADHVAAVATLATRARSTGDAALHGMVWGLGHTATLFLIGSVVIWLDTTLPERLAHGLEMAVGVMLIGLGADVLRRLFRDRIHLHVHTHGDGTRHLHAHSHAGETGRSHDPGAHHHAHPRTFPYRALLVGLMHGMAGSAALILLTLDVADSPWTGTLYMLVFGAGSILGMGLLSVAISVPLRASARGLTWLNNGLQAVLGTVTIALGVAVVAGLIQATIAGHFSLLVEK